MKLLRYVAVLSPSQFRHLLALTYFVVFSPAFLLGQGGYNDGRVMIQGFMWESHGADWSERWYKHLKKQVSVLEKAEFDLIWLPPPSQGEGAGYHPQQLFNFDTNYGSEQEHRDLIAALLENGIEPIADIVINHRNGSGGWATFKNPEWPANFICSDDEFWSQNPANLTPDDQAILASNNRGAPDYRSSNFPRWDGARDLDHSSSAVRQGIKDYLAKLKQFGYRGWRYDMVKGFAPGYVAEYDFDSKPTFTVGEYWDENPYLVSQWVDGTKQLGQQDPALKASSAFDFATWGLLKRYINDGQYDQLPALHFQDGRDDGLIAVNKDKAVTFLENHDTGWPQKQFDSFGNNEKLMQGYAYILTHPGIPCVFWKHYFDWKRGDEIKKLIKARKYAGVHSGSYIKSELHGGAYVAIVGDKSEESHTLIVKIGPGFGFSPDDQLWGLETSGEGYAVWVLKSKKAQTQSAVDSDKSPMPAPGS